MRKFYLLVLMVAAQLIGGIAAHGQTQTIFPFGSSWKYLDNGSDQGTSWRDASFNDASWASDTGTFGYGDNWITKCINACGTVACYPSCTNKYITTYFRKKVNIATASYDSVQFSVMRDDGFVLYVNGVEVWRTNMPSGTISYNTSAPTAIGSADEYTPITLNVPISAFTDGENTIAIEVHQNGGGSSDVTFNMQLKGYVKTQLMTYGSGWNYLDNGSNQGTAWSANSFNDASWAVGTGHIGYGETWTNTCIHAGATCSYVCSPGSSCAKYITAYLRKHLEVPNTALYDSVRFSVMMDDGIVMYVNGVEVWRYNMPTGTVAYNTLASGNIPESTAVVKSIPISAFANGDNVIAIEVHQNATTTSDMDFYLQAEGVLYTPPPTVTLTYGPYLQMGNQTGVSVRWRTNTVSKSRLMVGTVAGTYPIVVNDASLVTDHEVRVTGLTPDTKYYYSFGTDTSVLQGDTSNFFVTAPADGQSRRVTFAAFGDCGTNSNSNQSGSLTAYRNYLAANGMKAADLMLLAGDNAYNAGTDAEFSSNFFGAYSSTILKNHMLFPAPGNHDYANNGTRQVDHNIPYYSLFTMPTAGECGGVPSGTEAYYSFNWGDVHFLSLDSYGKENAGTTRLYDTTGAQVNWIKADLAANTKKWVVAYWHHPPYTMGSHNSDNEAELVSIRQNFIRILERYGVDLIICGHSHDYERSYLMKGYYGNEASFDVATHAVSNSSGKYDGSTNSCPYFTESGQVNHGTVYVVSGSSGASGGTQAGYPHNALPFSLDDGGMFFVDINENRLDAKFLRKDNTLYDQFTIMKDVNKTDTIEILNGASTDLKASWEGTYAWAPGANNRTINITPTQDTLVEVKDDLTNTCVNDKYYIDLQCTMPDITVVPADIMQDGCHLVATYSPADTGRPAPAYSYAFSGATTGSGIGTGSGSTFNIGMTTVTLTATNECGTTTATFHVTIQDLPTAFAVTGGGQYCPGGNGVNVGLANSQTGVEYQLYLGATAIGYPVAGTGSAISFGPNAGVGTYSVMATDLVTHCTNAMSGTVNVSLYTLPVQYTATGGGHYCAGGAGVAIGLDGSESGTSYQLYNGVVASGAAVAGTGSSISFGMRSIAGDYMVLATNTTTGCGDTMSGTVTVVIDPLPTVLAVTGGGSYCAGGTGVSIGLGGSVSGVSYQLYNGTSVSGSTVSGTGVPVSFGVRSVAGSYTVRATDMTTGCVNGMSGSASVSITPLVTPSVSVLPSVTGDVCAGTAVTYTAVAVNEGLTPSYIWYLNGMPVSALSTYGHYPADQDSVSVKLITSLPCVTAATVTDKVVMNVFPVVTPSATITSSAPGTICAGTPVMMTVSAVNGGSAPVYTWMKNSVAVGSDATYSFTPEDGDGVVLSMSSNAPCRTADIVWSNAITADVNTSYMPVVSITAVPGLYIAEGQSVKFTAAVANGGVLPKYQWYVNEEMMAGATSSTFTHSGFANNDSVSCVVTGWGVCGLESFNSVRVKVTTTGLASVENSGLLTVVPNPSNGTFTLSGKVADEGDVIVKVVNLLGQEVYSNTLTPQTGSINTQISLDNTNASGSYLLMVRTVNGAETFHIVVNR